MTHAPDLPVVTLTWNEPRRLDVNTASVANQEGVHLERIAANAGLPGEPTRERGCAVVPAITVKPSGLYDTINYGLVFAQRHGVVTLNSGDTITSSGSASSGINLLAHARWASRGLRSERGDGKHTHYLAPSQLRRHALGLAFAPYPAQVMTTECFLSTGGFNESLGIAAGQASILKAGRNSWPVMTDLIIREHLQGRASGQRGSREIALNFAVMRRSRGMVIGGFHNVNDVANAGVVVSCWVHQPLSIRLK